MIHLLLAAAARGATTCPRSATSHRARRRWRPTRSRSSRRRIPGVEIREGYGLTETSALVSTNPPGRASGRSAAGAGPPVRGRPRRGSAGTARSASAPTLVMAGYWNAPGADGGDDPRRLAAHRRHGPARRRRLPYDRRPQEGPDHPRRLQRLPARRRGRAAASTRRSRRRASSAGPIRCTARRSSRSSTLARRRLGAEELVAFGRERLGGYKYPREIHVLDALPLTPVGKLDRKALRELLNGAGGGVAMTTTMTMPSCSSPRGATSARATGTRSTQEQINRFADATLDQQWIHVDPEAAAHGPFGDDDRARLPDALAAPAPAGRDRPRRATRRWASTTAPSGSGSRARSPSARACGCTRSWPARSGGAGRRSARIAVEVEIEGAGEARARRRGPLPRRGGARCLRPSSSPRADADRPRAQGLARRRPPRRPGRVRDRRRARPRAGARPRARSST